MRSPTPPRSTCSARPARGRTCTLAESIDDAVRFGDTPVPVAGDGAPLVAEFCVAEFAAALGLPTETGKAYLGEALELRHRLPRTWARVRGRGPAGVAGPADRPRHDRPEPVAAAGFVDDQVAGFAHRIRPTGVDRLVEEAIVRFMPDEARRRREAADDGRHAHVHTHQVSFEGTVWVEAEVDLADALDLDTALSVGAARLADLGSAASLDVRRSEALGQMARHQLSLDLDTTTDTETTPAQTSGRQVVLHVHVSEDAIIAARPTRSCIWPGWRTPARFVDAEQVRAWCGVPGTTVTVKPVLDLTEKIHVDQYQVPDRLAAQAAERDLTCVFPWCTRPAEACDNDHVIPYSEGGPTASDNIATALSSPSPAQDPPLRLGLHRPGTRLLPVAPHRTATSSCATTAAPPTSPATRHRTRRTSSDPAPHPAPDRLCAGPPACLRADRTPGTTFPTPAREHESRCGRAGAGGVLPAGSVKGGMAAPECATTADAVADTATQRLPVATRQCRKGPDPRATDA